MKVTIKKLNKRYGLNIRSIYSPKYHKRVWGFLYKGKDMKFETKDEIYAFLQSQS